MPLDQLSKEQAEAIRAALPTELPLPDRGRLLALAEASRRALDDEIYDRDPRAREAAALSIQATLLRAGITEEPATPQTVAQAMHAASFRVGENPAAAMIAEQESIVANSAASEHAKALATAAIERLNSAWGRYCLARDAKP